MLCKWIIYYYTFLYSILWFSAKVVNDLKCLKIVLYTLWTSKTFVLPSQKRPNNQVRGKIVSHGSVMQRDIWIKSIKCPQKPNWLNQCDAWWIDACNLFRLRLVFLACRHSIARTMMMMMLLPPPPSPLLWWQWQDKFALSQSLHRFLSALLLLLVCVNVENEMFRFLLHFEHDYSHIYYLYILYTIFCCQSKIWCNHSLAQSVKRALKRNSTHTQTTKQSTYSRFDNNRGIRDVACITGRTKKAMKPQKYGNSLFQLLPANIFLVLYSS